MFKYTIAILFVFAALAYAQSPTCPSYNTGYQFGYGNIGYNFLRRSQLMSYSESGGFAVDVVNQQQAAFFRIQFNNSDNYPIFEEGLELYYAQNNSAYVLSNGVCFLINPPSAKTIPTTLVPSNVKYSNQVTLGSAKYNTYTSPFFDGQHSYLGVFEPTTCIPMNSVLSNVDYTLGESATTYFDFSTTNIDSNIFNLPPPCYEPRTEEYTGFRSIITEMMEHHH